MTVRKVFLDGVEKVLIVDDEFSIRDMLRMALEIADLNVWRQRTFKTRIA